MAEDQKKKPSPEGTRRSPRPARAGRRTRAPRSGARPRAGPCRARRRPANPVRPPGPGPSRAERGGGGGNKPRPGGRPAPGPQPRRFSGAMMAWGAVGLVIVIVAVLVVVKVATGSSAGATSYTPVTAAPASVVKDVTTIPASVYNKVGVNFPSAAQPVSPPIKLKNQPPLTIEGKSPAMLYYGAEYCPYCAAERWGIVAALSRFGTWSQPQDHRLVPHRRLRQDPHLQLPRGHLHQPVPDLRLGGAVQQRPGVGRGLHHAREPDQGRAARSSTTGRSTSRAPPPARSASPSSTSATWPSSPGPPTTRASWPASPGPTSPAASTTPPTR